jgi:predicted nucleic acid-binding protein
MIFWDSSAVVPLLVDESPRDALLELLRRDSGMIVWWGTQVECASAIARREREGALGAASQALERLRTVAEEWHEVLATNTVRSVALRMLRVHALRAADSLQLAAAFVAAEHDPFSLEFVSLDDRLIEAADREGFRILRA